MEMMKLVFLTAFVLLGLFFISSQAITCYKCEDCPDPNNFTKTCTENDEKASCSKTKFYSLEEGQLILSFCHSSF